MVETHVCTFCERLTCSHPGFSVFLARVLQSIELELIKRIKMTSTVHV